MAKRESYSAAIKCKCCNNSGTGTYEENENPVHGRGFDTVESVSDGFEIRKENCRDVVYCSRCKKKAS
jgi:hypothetical protein